MSTKKVRTGLALDTATHPSDALAKKKVLSYMLCQSLSLAMLYEALFRDRSQKKLVGLNCINSILIQGRSAKMSGRPLGVG